MDWEEARRRAAALDDGRTIANLEIVDRIGRGSRSLSQAVRRRPAVRPYLVVLGVVVALQVGLAGARFVIAPPDVDGVPTWLVLVVSVWFAAAGIVVAAAGRWDPRTAPLAGLFLAIASATAMPLLPHDPVTSGAGLLRWPSALLVEAFFPFFLWRFVEQFPRVVRVERLGTWIAMFRRLSLAAGAVLFTVNLAASVVPSRPVFEGPATFLLRGPVSGYWLVLFVLAIPAPIVVFARLRFAEAEERRRAWLFVAGLAVGILPIVVAALLAIVWPAWMDLLRPPDHRLVASLVVYAFLMTMPVSMGYAAAARHVVELRFVVGRAARAALARATLWTLAGAPWLGLAAVLWAGRERPLTELARTPTVAVLAAVGAVALVALANRDRLLAGVERSLLEGRRSPGAALAELAHRLAVARDGEELADAVRRHAESAMGSEWCRLLVREPDGGFRSFEPGVRRLESGSALVVLAEETPDAISSDLRDRDSWMPWLPEEDCLWLAETDTRLMLPVSGPAGECRALLAYGPHRSGSVYGTVHREAAEAVSSSLSLAMARLGSEASAGLDDAAGSIDTAAGECLHCGRVAPDRGGRCSCGGELIPAAIPYVLGGKFRLERVLGRGGMGVVYLALDSTLGRRVALKTLPRMRSSSLVRLRREARSMASFVHPNLALIFGAETWRGVPVLVVEYLVGGSLAARLTRANDPVWVLDVGAKLARALDALHGKGLLHRDVKPANIGFSEALEPKLLDFGLVRIVERSRADVVEVHEDCGPAPGAGNLTRTDHVVGTPRYLSPEVLRGEAPSPAQDLWGLHVVLWEALAGHHPLAGLSTDEVLVRIRDREIPDLRSVRPDCPEPVARLLARGLGRRRAGRASTARQLADELEAVRRELDGVRG